MVGWFASLGGVGCLWCLGMPSPIIAGATVLSIPPTFALAGGQPGYAVGEVGAGGVDAGDVIVDAACEGGASDGPADAVCVGCAAVVLGVGGVVGADGDVGVIGSLGVVVVGDVAGGVFATGARGGAPMVRVPGPLGAGPLRQGISSPLLAEGAAGVAACEGGGCDGVVDAVGAAPGDVHAEGGDADDEGEAGGSGCGWSLGLV